MNIDRKFFNKIPVKQIKEHIKSIIKHDQVISSKDIGIVEIYKTINIIVLETFLLLY